MPEMAKVARARSRTAARSSSPAPASALVPRRTPLAARPEQLRGLSPASRAAAVRNLQARVGNQAVARLLGEGPPPLVATHPDHNGQLVQREGRSSSGEQDANRGRTFVRSQAEPSAHAAQAVPASVANTVRSPGQPLEPTVRQEMASRLGADFAAVRTHTDAAASRSAADIGAWAYTVGSHIVFRAGEYQPSTPPGRHLLAHELTHVIQQRYGPVTGTDTGSGLKISNPADPFERAAKSNAVRAMFESVPCPQAAQRMVADTAVGEATCALHGPGPEPAVQRTITWQPEGQPYQASREGLLDELAQEFSYLNNGVRHGDARADTREVELAATGPSAAGVVAARTGTSVQRTIENETYQTTDQKARDAAMESYRK